MYTTRYLQLSLAIAGFLLLAYLAYEFEIQFYGLHAVLEYALLPALFAQVIVLVVGILRYRKYMEWRVLAGIFVLAISTLLTFGSFFL